MKNEIKTIPDFLPSQEVMGTDGLSGIAVDINQSKICLIKNSTMITKRVIGYRDIISVELFEDGDSISKTSRTSQIGGALVGGVLLGGAGVLLGGLTGSKRTSSKIKTIDLRILVNDPVAPLHDIKFLNFESKKDSFSYKNAINSARHWHGVLEVLIKRADSEVSVKNPVMAKQEITTIKPSSIADELKKLGELKDSGILTSEEFQVQKKKLLNMV